MGVFLTAEWRQLAMFNFAIDPAIIEPLLPHGTEIDMFDGETFVSIVGFLFLDTRVLNIPVPFHRDFEEVNLRFYVRRRDQLQVKRGAVFVQELVPRRAVAFLANAIYNEHYRVARMSHVSAADRFTIHWELSGQRDSFEVRIQGAPETLREGSFDYFIAEHYWGYAAQKNGDTVEYAVQHPPWRVWQVENFHLDIDFATLYGQQFAATLSREPRSVFMAEGSAVSVSNGKRIRASRS